VSLVMNTVGNMKASLVGSERRMEAVMICFDKVMKILIFLYSSFYLLQPKIAVLVCLNKIKMF
jgi:hypothetical protein